MPMRKRPHTEPFVDVDDLYRRGHSTAQAAPNEPSTTQRLSTAIDREHAAAAADRSLKSERGHARSSVLVPLAVAGVALNLLGMPGREKSASTEPVAADADKVALVRAEEPLTAIATVAATAPDVATKARTDALGIAEHTRAVGQDGFVGAGLTPTEESLQTAAQQREANNEGPRDIPPELLAAQVDYWGGAPASEAAIETAHKQNRFNNPTQP